MFVGFSFMKEEAEEVTDCDQNIDSLLMDKITKNIKEM